MKLRPIKSWFAPGRRDTRKKGRSFSSLARIEPLESRVLLSITAPPISGSWTQALNENFDTLDPSIWTNGSFWWGGNGTYSGTFLPSQATVSNGILSLTAINKPSVNSNGVTEPLTSGMINTGGIQGQSTPGFAFTYGFIDIRMQCAPGSGIWSALWMLPISHQDRNGELDVAENVSTNPTASYGGYHYGPTSTTTQLSYNDQTSFHDYGLDWEPGSLTWYIDGTAVYTYKGANVPAQAEYAIINLDCYDAPGWDGSTANALPSSTMQVDYLRVWQHTPNFQFGSQVQPAVNQFSDPSFENLAIGGLGTSTYVPSTFDWQYFGQAALITNGSSFGNANAPDGVQAVAIQGLQGYYAGSLTQTLNITAAGNYQITLAAAQRSGYSVEPIAVSVDGNVVATITPGSTAWKTYSTPTFTLSAGNHVFAFTATTLTSPSDSDSFMDTVNLVAAAPVTAPTGLAVTTGYTGDKLTWTASPGALGYNIYRGTTAGGESSTPVASGVTATSFIDSNVVTGTTYYYYVTAVYSSLTPPNTESSPSSEVSTSAGIITAVPGQIEAENYNLGGEGVAYHDLDASNNGGQYRNDGVDIEPTSDTGGGYDVGWVAAGEWMKYTVNVATTGTYTLGVRVASPVAGGTFHVESDGTNITGAMTVPNTGGWQTWTTLTKTVSLTAGTHVLRFYVDTAASNGWLANVNWMNLALVAATGDTTPPSTPTGLAVTGQTLTSVSLSWTASTDNVGVTGYTVYRGATAVGNLSGSTTTFTDTGLTPGASYSYTVVASDAAGNKSPATSPVTGTTIADTVAPTQPTNLAVTATTATSVSLSWTASTDNVGVTGYTIYRGTTVAGTVGGTTLAFTDTGVSAGTTYSYTVVASDAAGNKSTASTAVSATTSNAVRPTGVTVTSAYTGETLSWTATAGAASYSVYRGTTAGGESTTPIATGLTATSFVDTGVVTGTTYYYYVTAVLSSTKAATPASSEVSAVAGIVTAAPGQ